MVKKELSPNKVLGFTGVVLLAAYFIPFDSPQIAGAIHESFLMLSEYAREHVLLCLVPAMFIAGELGFKKTAVYVFLVIILSTFAGWIFGIFV